MPSRTWILVAAVALALVAIGGVALAEGAIPGPDGVINACRNFEGGRLRVVPSGRACRTYERPLKWNARGPVGPAGVAGPVGPAGPQGQQGPQGDPAPSLSSFDALAGLACAMGSRGGSIAIDYDVASGEAHIRCVVSPAPPAPVRINEFSTGTEGALTDEFVEVVNVGTEPADLSGYKLVYRSGAGTSDVSLGTLPDGTLLAAGGFLLFGGAGYAGAHPADRSFGISLASTGGGVGLRDPTGALLDSVAWGTATNEFVEETVAAAPPIAPAPGKSSGRHPDGNDTNDNAADFTIIETPTPGGSN
jgi:lamin tail-like protein